MTNDPKILDRLARCAVFAAEKCDDAGWRHDADDQRMIADILRRMAQVKRDEFARRHEKSGNIIYPQNQMPDLIHAYRNRTTTQNDVNKSGRFWNNKQLAFTTPYRRCDAPIPPNVAAGALLQSDIDLSDDLWHELNDIANEGHG